MRSSLAGQSPFDLIENPPSASGGSVVPLSSDRIGMAQLVRLAYAGRDLTPLRQNLEARIGDPGAGMDLSVIEQVSGRREAGLRLQERALEQQRCYRLSGSSPHPRLRVLALAAPLDIGGNTPIDFLIADPTIQLTILYVVPGRFREERIPDHDIVMVTMPDEVEAAASLDEIRSVTPHWPRPVLNPPEKIGQLDRDRLFPIIASIPNLTIPVTVRVGRHEIEAIGAGTAGLPAALDWPLIVRPTGSHAGRGLERLTGPAAVAAYLDANPGPEFFMSRFVDYSSPDGLFRKYRVVLVDGQPFACHMAITELWAVWYLNADMYASADKRDEEARFMQQFDTGFGLRHGAALGEIAACLGLDYVVVDCAETRDGDLLVFEAGAAMIVHDMDSEVLFPYKAPQMRKIFAAFAAMLDRRVSRARAPIG